MKICGFDVVEITEKYGTPLYIYDVLKLKENMNLYKDNFKSNVFECEVAYASKAFSILPFIKLVKEEDLSIDVVSLGEAKTALDAGFIGKNIYLHGNNKSVDELKLAIEKEFNIVLDNLEELQFIQKLNVDNKKINLLLRVNFGIEAHTHKYILTGNLDSKFGVRYGYKDYQTILDTIKKDSNLNLLGFHSHIGSQIFEVEPYYALIDKYAKIAKELDKDFVFSLGGGFGVKYTENDHPKKIDEISKAIITYTENKFKSEKLKIKKLVIEPGRSIVSDACVMVYKLGFKKNTPNKTYYFIDGGMSDNIRPAIYQAKYRADILGRENNPKNLVTVAGKCCESGDILIEDILLPDYEYGDILVVYDCGAYSYQMASNYNKNLIPGVVFVDDKGFKEVVKQEYEDLA